MFGQNTLWVDMASCHPEGAFSMFHIYPNSVKAVDGNWASDVLNSGVNQDGFSTILPFARSWCCVEKPGDSNVSIIEATSLFCSERKLLSSRKWGLKPPPFLFKILIRLLTMSSVDESDEDDLQRLGDVQVGAEGIGNTLKGLGNLRRGYRKVKALRLA